MKKNDLNLLLPDDLVIEILEWLPVKSLVRFKCVTKHWSALFKTRAFLHNHRRKQGSKATMLLVRRLLPPPEFDPNKDDLFSFHNLDSPRTLVLDSLSITFLKDIAQCDTIPGNVNLIGSCNGIVFIMYAKKFILCNPALREFKILPPFSSSSSCRRPMGLLKAVGFGVTSCGHDFKFVVMHNVFDGRHRWGQNCWSYIPSAIMVHVYSSKTDSWKQIDDAPLIPTFQFIKDVVFVNGACHWLGRTFSDVNCRMMLLSLDMDSEVFRQLELPDSLCKLDIATILTPIVLHECLGLLISYYGGETIDVWVMKEYDIKESWTKTVVISPKPTTSDFLPWKNDIFIIDEPLYGLPPGDILDEQCNGQLTSISLHTKEEKEFQVYGFQYSMRVLIHDEILVSLN